MTNPRTTFRFAVVGGGIVGLATARALSEMGPVVVLEAEKELASHQSRHNSGVLHSGLYYRPGSLKARLCTAGRRQMVGYCRERGLPLREDGKLVVATRENELPALDELERRGQANGLEGLQRLGSREITEREREVRGLAGLWVPQTGLTDYRSVSLALAADVMAQGGEVRTGWPVRALHLAGHPIGLDGPRDRLHCDFLVVCAGLHSDRLARLAGLDPQVQILPFRGEYFEMARPNLVRVPVYPVPDPRFPFLGVHLTPTVHGGLEAGPNALLGLAREGYRRRDVHLRDLVEMVTFPGFRRLLHQIWRPGLAEAWRASSRRRFAAELAQMVPAVKPTDLLSRRAGVRAQAVDRRGRLLDDFHLLTTERALFVLNAPSPAATASLAIAEHLADEVRGHVN